MHMTYHKIFDTKAGYCSIRLMMFNSANVFDREVRSGVVFFFKSNPKIASGYNCKPNKK